MKMIGAANGKKIHLVKGFCWLLKIFGLFTGLVNKAFGNLSYEMEISQYKVKYIRFCLEESIKETER